jgi:hypothetical protein
MDLKIPSAMVERHMFPKHTKSTEIGFVSEVMIVLVCSSSSLGFGTTEIFNGPLWLSVACLCKCGYDQE